MTVRELVAVVNPFSLIYVRVEKSNGDVIPMEEAMERTVKYITPQMDAGLSPVLLVVVK